MALAVAALLDEFCVKSEWADASYVALNDTLGGVKVKPGYSVLVTIAERNYLLSSNDKGVLSVLPGPHRAKDIARARCRLVVDADALSHIDEEAAIVEFLAKRKLRLDGDSRQLASLDKELSPHVSLLRQAVEAVGPDPSAMQTAIEEHNMKIEGMQIDSDNRGLGEPGLEGALRRRSHGARPHELVPGRFKPEGEGRQWVWSNQEGRARPIGNEVPPGGLKTVGRQHTKASWESAMLDVDNPWQEPDAFSYEYFREEIPLLMSVTGWVLFSTGSTPFGSVGQTNYNAACQILDAQTFSMRTTNGMNNFTAITNLQGAVGTLGMRWKAFASLDAIGYGEDSGLQTPQEAMMIYRVIFLLGPEWPMANKMPSEAASQAFLYQMNARTGVNKRFGYGKGKGGGAVDSLEGTFHDMIFSKTQSNGLSADDEEMRTEDPVAASDDSWLIPGRRIRIVGLKNRPEMNDVKGTLVEEVKPGAWQVHLDDGLGEKLLKTTNMARVRSSAVKQQALASDAMAKVPREEPPEPMCIAGDWDAWMPHDMQWDDDSKCYVFKVILSNSSDTYFGVNRGAAGNKPWKAGSIKKWCTGNAKGWHVIKVFVKDRKLCDVRWEPCQKP